MPRHLISFDLNAPGKDYQKLNDELKRLGAVKVLYSQWALRNDANAEALREHFWQFMDANDRLLVSNLDGGWASMRAMADINAV